MKDYKHRTCSADSYIKRWTRAAIGLLGVMVVISITSLAYNQRTTTAAVMASKGPISMKQVGRYKSEMGVHGEVFALTHKNGIWCSVTIVHSQNDAQRKPAVAQTCLMGVSK